MAWISCTNGRMKVSNSFYQFFLVWTRSHSSRTLLLIVLLFLEDDLWHMGVVMTCADFDDSEGDVCMISLTLSSWDTWFCSKRQILGGWGRIRMQELLDDDGYVNHRLNAPLRIFRVSGFQGLLPQPLTLSWIIHKAVGFFPSDANARLGSILEASGGDALLKIGRPEIWRYKPN